MPPRRRIELGHRSVFIFPSRTGWLFAGLLALMLLGAINYQNSLVFALTFLLTSMGVVAIAHTYRNLAGLTVEGLDASPVFAGDHALFSVRLERPRGRVYSSLRLGWSGEFPRDLDLVDRRSETVRLAHTAPRRGWLSPGRLLLETTYPLGLLRAWTWLDLDVRGLVYPRPLSGEPPGATGDGSGDGHVARGGGDDFLGLREYRRGDSLKHIAWNVYAREGELLIKQYGSPVVRELWLDWEVWADTDTETRLSRLAGWAVALEKRGATYGLRLPGQTVAPGSGRAHRNAVLQALALFGLGDESVA